MARAIEVFRRNAEEMERLKAAEEIQERQHKEAFAARSWRDPAGESPVRVGGSARPVASVAGSLVTTAAKRTQQDDEDCIEL